MTLAAVRALVAGAILVAGATLLVGCTDASRATIGPSGAPASAVPTARATSVAPTETAPAVTVGPGQTTAEDSTLLAILPATVAGATISREPASFPEALHDRSFVANVDRAVFAVVADGDDLASGVVAHLRAGAWSDKFFGDWRASYDDGACAQSGGIVAHAETTSGGRTVYVTTCGGGLRVYHAYVADRGVIVSLFSTGPADLGGQLMGQLGS